MFFSRLSLTVSLLGFHTQVVVEPQGHVDVGLVELAVTLGQVRVSATRFAEAEARGVNRIDLLQSLDATPGLQSLDLGAGMIQPVVRGLYGTRVAVLEDGVPQQGGRWGSEPRDAAERWCRRRRHAPDWGLAGSVCAVLG